MRILGISGSLRTGSYNTKALSAAQLLVPEGVELDIYALHDIPLYNADVEKEGIPASVAALREAVGAGVGEGVGVGVSAEVIVNPSV